MAVRLAALADRAARQVAARWQRRGRELRIARDNLRRGAGDQAHRHGGEGCRVFVRQDLEGRLESPDIDFIEHGRLRMPDADQRCRVNNRVGTGRGEPHAAPVADVSVNRVARKPRCRGPTREHDRLVPAPGQRTHDRPAEIPAAPGHQNAHKRRIIKSLPVPLGDLSPEP